MKSKGTNIPAFSDFDLPKEDYYTDKQVEAAVQEEIRHIMVGRKKTVHPDSVEKGDVAVLNLESSIPRYNRNNLPLTVGMNLFNKELEEALIGKECNKSYDITIDGENVRYTITSITRKIAPELTDEIVAEAMAGGDDPHPEIRTVEQYMDFIRKDCEEACRDECYVKWSDKLIEYLFDNTTWDIDDDELGADIESYMKDIEDELAEEEEGKTVDNLTESDYKMYFDGEVSNKAELYDYIRNELSDTYKMSLIAWNLKGIDSSDKNIFDDGEYLPEYTFAYVKEHMKIVKKEDN